MRSRRLGATSCRSRLRTIPHGADHARVPSAPQPSCTCATLFSRHTWATARACYVVASLMITHLHFVLLLLASLIDERQRRAIHYLRAENRVLREQLGVRRLRLTDPQRRRLAVAAKALGRAALRALETIVTPDTLLRWYAGLVAQKYDGSTQRRRVGRPPKSSELRDLVVRLARENPTWGYTRIRGQLSLLGHQLGRSTIARMLADAGIDPSPNRPTRWREFLQAHLGEVFAADFFTAEVLTISGLVRHHVLFVIDLATRRVEIAGIVRCPDGAWMKQVVRNLTDAFDGFLLRAKYLIVDRDPLFTGEVRQMLAASGVKTVRLPARSPNLNSVADRFVGSIRRECLDHVIPLGAGHLRRVVHAYASHYNRERPHQSVGNGLLEPTTAANGSGPIQCRERVGGLLRFYHREAA